MSKWDNSPEYNPLGDAATGTTGSLTPASQANAAATAKSTGNPFTDVLNHVNGFNMLASMPPASSGAPSMGPAFVLGDPNAVPTNPFVGTVPGLGNGSPTPPGAMPPSYTGPDTWVAYSGIDKTGGDGGDGVRPNKPDPSAPDDGGVVHKPDETTPKITTSQAWSNDFGATITDAHVNEWYQYTAKNGWVDPVDFLFHTHPELFTTDAQKALVGRSGTDTYAAKNPPPSPTPAPTPPLPGPSGNPLAIGPTGEDPNQISQRWKQALIDKGKSDLADNVTPTMIAFYRENNSKQLDPVTWMEQGGLDAYNKWVAANPQGAAPGSMNVGDFAAYNPQTRTAFGPNTTPGVTSANAPNPQVATPLSSPLPSPTNPTNPDYLVTPSTTPTPPGGVTPTTAPPQKTNPDPFLATPPATTPSGTSAPNGDIQSIIDLFSKNYTSNQPGIESLLNPMYARQRQNLANDIRAQQAATGEIHSGGAGENLNDAMANLSGQQSADLAGKLSDEYLAKMQQNTALAGIATAAGMQKFTAELNADLTRYQINTNADLQKWLNDKDNTLKKYGIDTNDVLQRYLAKVGQENTQIDANARVQAAQLQAAASEAAAAGASAAAERNAQIQRELGLAGLGVDREKNIGNFILGLLGINNQNAQTANDILNGIPPGSIVVKP